MKLTPSEWAALIEEIREYINAMPPEEFVQSLLAIDAIDPY